MSERAKVTGPVAGCIGCATLLVCPRHGNGPRKYIRNNPFERMNRIRKVGKMALLIPYGVDAAAIAETARFFERASSEDRATLAEAAGVAMPSDTTWAMLIETLRARRPIVAREAQA